MSAVVAAGSAAARARETRARAAALRQQASAQRLRTDRLVDELADVLVSAGGPSFGDRGDHFELRLGRLRPMLRFARSDLRRRLETANVPPDIANDFTLACSEIVANAIEHPEAVARHTIEIEARCDGDEVELRVRDFGYWREQQRSPLARAWPLSHS